MTPEPKPGPLFLHYKGDFYVVIAVGTHSETGEKIVCYQSQADYSIWMRPLDMWNEIMPNGIPRFTQVGV